MDACASAAAQERNPPAPACVPVEAGHPRLSRRLPGTMTCVRPDRPSPVARPLRPRPYTTICERQSRQLLEGLCLGSGAGGIAFVGALFDMYHVLGYAMQLEDLLLWPGEMCWLGIAMQPADLLL